MQFLMTQLDIKNEDQMRSVSSLILFGYKGFCLFPCHLICFLFPRFFNPIRLTSSRNTVRCSVVSAKYWQLTASFAWEGFYCQLTLQAHAGNWWSLCWSTVVIIAGLWWRSAFLPFFPPSKIIFYVLVMQVSHLHV